MRGAMAIRVVPARREDEEGVIPMNADRFLTGAAPNGVILPGEW